MPARRHPYLATMLAQFPGRSSLERPLHCLQKERVKPARAAGPTGQADRGSTSLQLPTMSPGRGTGANATRSVGGERCPAQ